MVGAAVGLGPVFWLLIAEIYPLRVRGAAMSIATIANWTANFVVTVSFLTLISAISTLGVFMLFGFLTLVALGYFIRKVPETKGRSPSADRTRPDRTVRHAPGRRIGTAMLAKVAYTADRGPLFINRGGGFLA
jgi:MFS family permease